jgi:hypothetical protein
VSDMSYGFTTLSSLLLSLELLLLLACCRCYAAAALPHSVNGLLLTAAAGSCHQLAQLPSTQATWLPGMPRGDVTVI